MKKEKTIKEIYNLDYIETKKDNIAEWYNSVLNKTEADLTVFDVCRCIRQNLFVDSAVVMLISYLQQDIFSGDMYEGECMEKLSEAKEEYIIKYSDAITGLIEKAKNDIKTHEWLCEEDMIEYKDYIEKIEKALLSNS